MPKIRSRRPKTGQFTADLMTVDKVVDGRYAWGLDGCLSVVEEAKKRGTIFGELGPARRTNTVDIENVSHIIENVRISNNVVLADIRILKTPAGQIADELMRKGIELKLMPRGMATFIDGGTHAVVTKFELTSFDLCA